MSYFGTGWLIGRRHIITNHHVINARDPGEDSSSESDMVLQARATKVQFDYDSPESVGEIHQPIALSTANKVLDYAILELCSDPVRNSLPLWGRELTLPKDSYVPVNVVQHPGGASKQLGIRNNLVAGLEENDLAYFTDTEGGSSGSPVCNDEWKVLGLHKASSMSFGELNYQGKKTAWVNVGTRIDRIIADLRNNQAGLWDRIAANVMS